MAGKKKVNCSAVDWEKSPEYREAVLIKVIRAMKSYGYSSWMSTELRKIGISI
jgi:hypothetical protein